MAYTKTNWTNGAAPAINASNLNKIENGIYNNADWIDSQYFQPGEVYSKNFGGIVPCAGLITTGTTAVYFTVVLPKRLDNVSSFTVDAMTGGMRGVSGYVDGTNDNSDLKTGYTVTGSIMAEQTIRVVITKSSTMSDVSNNTPVTVALRSIVLTFS